MRALFKTVCDRAGLLLEAIVHGADAAVDLLGECFAGGGVVLRLDGIPDGDAGRAALGGARLADLGGHVRRRRHELVRVHGHGVEVERLARLHPEDVEHEHGLGVEGSDDELARLGVGAVAAAGRGHPEDLAALGEELAEARHRLHVLLLLLVLELRRVVDVLLGVDAQQVAAHGEGDGERVRRHLVAGHADDLLGELLRLRAALEEQRDDLRVGLGLVVRQEHDVLAALQALHDLVELLLALEAAVLLHHQRAEEVVAPGVEVRRLVADGLVERAELVRLHELLREAAHERLQHAHEHRRVRAGLLVRLKVFSHEPLEDAHELLRDAHGLLRRGELRRDLRVGRVHHGRRLRRRRRHVQRAAARRRARRHAEAARGAGKRREHQGAGEDHVVH
mmetsp:Transcript_10197/g.30400  ORF Transcript_10197/g.30400 Transcript_10197/m.30400 type:complete len:394 (+) Transcript_10197:2116-3297(+)